MNTPTPAEAAYLAICNHQPIMAFSELNSKVQNAWTTMANAAINAHLTTVAKELPTVEAIEACFPEFSPTISTVLPWAESLRRTQNIFAERFAKLKAERGEAIKAIGNQAREYEAKLQEWTTECDKWMQWQEDTCVGGQVLAKERDSLRQQLAESQARLLAQTQAADAAGGGLLASCWPRASAAGGVGDCN